MLGKVVVVVVWGFLRRERGGKLWREKRRGRVSKDKVEARKDLVGLVFKFCSGSSNRVFLCFTVTYFV